MSRPLLPIIPDLPCMVLRSDFASFSTTARFSALCATAGGIWNVAAVAVAALIRGLPKLKSLQSVSWRWWTAAFFLSDKSQSIKSLVKVKFEAKRAPSLQSHFGS